MCRFGRIEDGCALPCNCRSGDKCHRDSGCEEGFCEQDIHAGGPFSGEGCQKGEWFLHHSSVILLYDNGIHLSGWNELASIWYKVVYVMICNHCIDPDSYCIQHSCWRIYLFISFSIYFYTFKLFLSIFSTYNYCFYIASYKKLLKKYLFNIYCIYLIHYFYLYT